MRSTGRISYFIRVTIKVNSDSILCFSRSRRASGTKFLTVSSATKLIKAVVGKECLNLVFLESMPEARVLRQVFHLGETGNVDRGQKTMSQERESSS